MSEDSDFDGEWKEKGETKVHMCSSTLCVDDYLDWKSCRLLGIMGKVFVK